jgi:hypothetical protein
MKREILFIQLYVIALVRHLIQRTKQPLGLKAKAIGLFVDPLSADKKPHGVAIFIIPTGNYPDKYGELWGPFGASSSTKWKGKHLYNRDQWGTVNDEQIDANPILRQLSQQYPHRIILLAGVRKFHRWHIWPLNKPEKFILEIK